MKKMYFIGLSILALASCSTTNDDLQNFDKQNINQSASGGFRDGSGSFNEDTPSNGIFWKSNRPPNPIYGFYSSSLRRHVYSNESPAERPPQWLPGPHNYFYDRFLGSANGNGDILTAWYNENSEDMIITTNPDEIKGAWKKYRDFGRTYNGDEPGSYPIYRYFRSKYNSHFYTKDFNELGNGKDGFVYEGIAFYLKESEGDLIRIHDGQFFKDSKSGYLYVTIESTLRRIDSQETFNRVFNYKRPIYENNLDDFYGPRGNDITSSTKLIQDGTNNKIYLLDSGYLRYIPSSIIMDIYYFNRENVVKNNRLNGFVGKDITKTY